MALANPFTAALSTSSASSGFTAKIPKITEPSGAGIFKIIDAPYGGADCVPSFVHLVPYGTDGDNDTFSMRLWGWTQVSQTKLWIPYKLLEIGVVFGSISGAAIGTGVFMADTVTLTKGIPAGPFSGLLNMADDTTGGIVIHTLGAQYLEFDFHLTGAQAGTGANCYFRLLSFD